MKHMDIIKEIVEFLTSFKGSIHDMSLFDYKIFILNLLIVTIIFIVYYDIKLKYIYKDKHLLMTYAIIVILEFLLELIFGNILVLTPLFSFFAVHIVLFIKNKDIFDSLSNHAKEKRGNDPKGEMGDLYYKMRRLGKNEDFNIIDILYIYDYITEYQRKKIMQTLICESMETMVDYLLSQPTITQAELKEARAIKNLISFEHRIVTKDEAMVYLLNNESYSEQSTILHHTQQQENELTSSRSTDTSSPSNSTNQSNDDEDVL